jgi:hypothetical protein
VNGSKELCDCAIAKLCDSKNTVRVDGTGEFKDLLIRAIPQSRNRAILLRESCYEGQDAKYRITEYSGGAFFSRRFDGSGFSRLRTNSRGGDAEALGYGVY